MTMSNIKEINDSANLDEVISSGVTVIDFWTEWCSPCKAQTTILEALKDEMDQMMGIPISIYKVDVDKLTDMVKRFQIRSIPHIVVFKDGQIKEVMTGLQRKESIIKSVKRVVNS